MHSASCAAWTELIPVALSQDIDMEDVDEWLDYAAQSLSQVPGGMQVISAIKSFIADSKVRVGHRPCVVSRGTMWTLKSGVNAEYRTPLAHPRQPSLYSV
jgi:hypothetical protein